MKKNITINLFGQLYNIDEDAYELLEKYQKNIRSYFSRREGGEEVAAGNMTNVELAQWLRDNTIQLDKL